MAELELKKYQQESLDAIARFCDLVPGRRRQTPCAPVHDAYYAACGRDFLEVPQLPGIPYFCLRVPTGGGKTLIASRAVARCKASWPPRPPLYASG